jgi:hypothetical protein
MFAPWTPQWPGTPKVSHPPHPCPVQGEGEGEEKKGVIRDRGREEEEKGVMRDRGREEEEQRTIVDIESSWQLPALVLTFSHILKVTITITITITQPSERTSNYL